MSRRIVVGKVISGRYQPGSRPLSWDMRQAGTDTIQTTTGETISLFSTGQQSTPAPGWELLLMPDSQTASAPGPEAGVAWTLYGLGIQA